MSTKQQLTNLVRDMGCTIDWERWEINAPDNHRFVGGPHTIVFEPYDWDNFTWKEQYSDAITRLLETGLEECHCGDCDAQEAQ
jgi:hypothetical protein